MSVSRVGSSGTTVPWRGGRWLPQPAPEPVRRTTAPCRTTTVLATSAVQASLVVSRPADALASAAAAGLAVNASVTGPRFSSCPDAVRVRGGAGLPTPTVHATPSPRAFGADRRAGGHVGPGARLAPDRRRVRRAARPRPPREARRPAPTGVSSRLRPAPPRTTERPRPGGRNVTKPARGRTRRSHRAWR